MYQKSCCKLVSGIKMRRPTGAMQELPPANCCFDVVVCCIMWFYCVYCLFELRPAKRTAWKFMETIASGWQAHSICLGWSTPIVDVRGASVIRRLHEWTDIVHDYEYNTVVRHAFNRVGALIRRHSSMCLGVLI